MGWKEIRTIEEHFPHIGIHMRLTWGQAKDKLQTSNLYDMQCIYVMKKVLIKKTAGYEYYGKLIR